MTLITTIQIIVSILLVLSILLQHRASGLTATFGGAGATFVQRRGAEKFVFRATIVLSGVFFALSVIQWYL